MLFKRQTVGPFEQCPAHFRFLDIVCAGGEDAGQGTVLVLELIQMLEKAGPMFVGLVPFAGVHNLHGELVDTIPALVADAVRRHSMLLRHQSGMRNRIMVTYTNGTRNVSVRKRAATVATTIPQFSRRPLSFRMNAPMPKATVTADSRRKYWAASTGVR